MNTPNPNKAWAYVPAAPVVPADDGAARYRLLFRRLGIKPDAKLVIERGTATLRLA